MKHLILGLWFFTLVMGPSLLKSQETSAKPRKIRPVYPIIIYSVIDTPTAEVLDYGSFAFTTRFFSAGGILPGLSFGVFQRLMLGSTFGMDNYIGHGSVDIQQPALQIKFRFYDGSQKLPACAIGYDSQGYRYDQSQKLYADPKKGLYLAFSREVLFKDLEATAGFNISDFERDQFRFFGNMTWVFSGVLGLLLEYDNIHNIRYNRLNSGATLFLSPSIQMGFHVRDILATNHFETSSLERNPERIIDIRYTTNF